MINQGRYIASAFFILFLLLSVLFVFEKFTRTNSVTPNDFKSGDNVNRVDRDLAGLSAGKSLFGNNCAACHAIFKDMVGPALTGLEERGPWKDRKKLYSWVHNPAKFMSDDRYTRSLKERFGAMMTSFPDLKENEIDAIVDYINGSQPNESSPVVLKN